MTDSQHQSVVRRMTRGGRPPPEFGEISPAKALRLALAKAGQDVLSQPVTASGVEELRLAVDKIAENLPSEGICLLLQGPNESTGLVNLDRNVIAAITQALTTGRVFSGQLGDRAPSATDAILCSRFLVMVLTIFAARLVGHSAAVWATGFVPDEPVPDLRRLPVLLDDVPYRLLATEVDFATGARVGQITIVLPWDGPAPEPVVPVAALPPPEEDDWNVQLRRAVMPVEVEFDAVLCRLPVPLGTMSELVPGFCLPIPRKSVEAVDLETLDGEVVAHGRLGQSQGNRALRLDFGLQENKVEQPQVDAEAESPLKGLATAMANAPSPFGKPSAAAPAPDFSASENGMPDLSALDSLPDLPDLPPLGDGEEEGFPAMDLGSIPMDDLDDLPMSIE